jgi:hypothetical protein
MSGDTRIPQDDTATKKRLEWLDHPVHDLYNKAIALSAALRGLQAYVDETETDVTGEMLCAVQSLAMEIEGGLRDLPERAEPKAVAS